MNIRTSALLATLLVSSVTAFAQAPATASTGAATPGTQTSAIPHDTKTGTAKHVVKKHHAHHKHAQAGATSNK